MPLPPVDDQISINDLTTDPYSFYRKARAHYPVVTVKAVGRTMLTKALFNINFNPVAFSAATAFCTCVALVGWGGREGEAWTAGSDRARVPILVNY